MDVKVDIPIIPKPNSVKKTMGAFQLQGPVSIQGLHEGFLFHTLSTILRTMSGLTIANHSDRVITFMYSAEVPEEGYQLIIANDGITIKYSDEAGSYYAVMTLKQLLYNRQQLEGLELWDAPRFKHRGFMLDVSRHFIPVEEIKRLIDIAAVHKLNRFHWHLTDDQGWRIQIDKYPRLTTHGSVRGRSVGKQRGPQLEYSNDGFYSKEEITGVIHYAKARHIEIIPEIDMPGHIRSAVSAYPHLSCSKKPIDVAVKSGIYEDVLCIGSDSTFEMMFDVLDEVIALFPFHRIHIGGDEVPKSRWYTCPQCQAFMKEHRIETGEGLQTFFANKIINYLDAQGRQSTLWNDSFTDGLSSQTAYCQFWLDGKEQVHVKRAVMKGHQIIHSDFRAYYFDYPYGFTRLEKTYTNQPVLDWMTEKEAALIEGVECCLWTEWVTNRKRLDHLMFPRLFAFAETAWTHPSNKSYASFKERLLTQMDFYTACGVGMQDQSSWDLRGWRAVLENLVHVTRMINMRTLIIFMKMYKEKRRNAGS